MKKIKQPKFLINVTGPFIEAKIPVYKGNGTTLLRQLKKVHKQSIDREFPKPVYDWNFLMKEWDNRHAKRRELYEWQQLRNSPENRLRVEIINCQAA